MPFKLDPIKRCALFMMVFTGTASLFKFSPQMALHLATTVGWGLMLYVFYSWVSDKRKNLWDTVITSAIIALLLHDSMGATAFVYPLLATFIAITQKFFIEFKNSPVINPVAFALLLTALITAFIPGMEKPFVSWWGTAFQGYLSLGLMGLWMVFGLHQWKKWPAVVSFLVAYLSLLLVRGQGWESLQFALTDSTLYFFATIMLVEPKTAPFRPKEQVAYGLFTAGLLSALIHWGAPYPQLFALAGANLIYFVHRIRSKKA
jgi:hypothetical protein